MKARPNYVIASDIPEGQVETSVATYLGWCTPEGREAPFRLIHPNEQETGADKVFDVGTAIYMQFKKSEGLRPTTKISTRKNKSKMELVREFRHAQELEDNPTLFFQLRQRANPAAELQHNVLLSYERPPLCRAVYVAPLHLKLEEYHAALDGSQDRWLLHPFTYLDVRISQRRWSSLVAEVPFLRGHISIPPQERVATHEHFYSYSRAGSDVAWHSPNVVTREPSRLTDTVRSFLQGAFSEDGMVQLESLDSQVAEIARDNGRTGSFHGTSPLARLMAHGKWLREQHNICQFLMVGRRSALSRWRDNVPA